MTFPDDIDSGEHGSPRDKLRRALTVAFVVMFVAVMIYLHLIGVLPPG